MTDAARICELCGQPVEVVTADEGTQSYRGVQRGTDAGRALREARRLLLLAAGYIDRTIEAEPTHPKVQWLAFADTALRQLSVLLPDVIDPARVTEASHQHYYDVRNDVAFCTVGGCQRWTVISDLDPEAARLVRLRAEKIYDA